MKLQATLVLAGALACCPLVHAQQGMRNGEWHYWGGDAGSTRYSSLEQINASNAKDLQIAWRWQSLPGEGQPDTRAQAAAPRNVATPPPTVRGTAPDPKQVTAGRPIFASHCAICHGRGGEGVADGPPALTSLRDATAIRERVTKGGVQMPAMRTVLTKEQIRDVSDYVAAGLPPEAP